MGLKKYLNIGLRWWWLLLISAALSASASYIYSQRLPKVYAAKTTMVVGTSLIESNNPDEKAFGLSRTLAQVYSDLARRRPITQAVIDRLGLDMSPDGLSGMIQTNVIPTAQLLEIFVRDVHPQRAQLLANTVAEELILQSPTGSGEQKERETFIRSQLAELQTKIESTETRIKELEEALSNTISALEIAEIQSQLDQLETLKSTYQGNYTQFLANLSEASPNKLTIFEPAIEPTYPVSPNVKMNVAVATVAGLALAVMAIILLEFFDDALVWQPGEKQSILGLSVLGAVGNLSKRANKLVVQNEIWSPEADALRNLRSNLFLTTSGPKVTMLVVTSASPGDGKSFISTNLAATIASGGNRVILIDADLRKTCLHETFDMPNLLGLSEALVASEDEWETILDKALRPTDIENLFLLPAGRPPFDPGFLLSSAQFPRLLFYLKDKADLIIIDSAPLLVAAETRFLINAVDGTILVVRDRQTRHKTLQEVIDSFDDTQGGNLMGLVFNRVNLRRIYSYYSSYSGYYSGRSRFDQKTSKPGFFRKLWPFGRNKTEAAMGLSLDEAAARLGVGNDTARRWCEQGRLPATKKRLRWVIDREELDRFIALYQTGFDSNEKVPSKKYSPEPDELLNDMESTRDPVNIPKYN